MKKHLQIACLSLLLLAHAACGQAEYGNFFVIDGRDGMYLDGSDDEVSMRFTAEKSGSVSEVCVVTGAKIGTSPDYFIGLQADGGGNPDGAWLGETSRAYAIISDTDYDAMDWVCKQLNEEATLVEGNAYHLLIKYSQGTIDSSNRVYFQYTSPKNYVYPPKYAEDFELDCRESSDGGVSWSSCAQTPQYAVKYSDGTWQTTAYAYYGTSSIYGGYLRGQLFTILGEHDLNVTRLWGFLEEYAGDPTAGVTIYLANTSGGLPDEVLAHCDIEDGRMDSYAWVDCAVEPTILSGGMQYALFFGQTDGGGDNSNYYRASWLRGKINGADTLCENTFGGTNDRYVWSSSNGSSWAAWDLCDDLSFKLTVEEVGGGPATTTTVPESTTTSSSTTTVLPETSSSTTTTTLSVTTSTVTVTTTEPPATTSLTPETTTTSSTSTTVPTTTTIAATTTSITTVTTIPGKEFFYSQTGEFYFNDSLLLSYDGFDGYVRSLTGDLYLLSPGGRVGFGSADLETTGVVEASGFACDDCLGADEINESQFMFDSDDDVDSWELDGLCPSDGKILKRVSGSWVCAEDEDTHTDTNANTICSGSSTYLDGDGNCDVGDGSGQCENGVICLGGHDHDTRYYTESESDSMFVSRDSWADHENYPQGCPPGSYATALGDTLNCTQDPLDTIPEWQSMCSGCVQNADLSGSISKNKLGNTGALGFQWADGEVSDTLTCSNYMPLFGGVLSGDLDLGGNKLTGVSEVAGGQDLVLSASGRVRIEGTLDLAGSCTITGSDCVGDIAEKMHSRKTLEGLVTGSEFESGDVVCASGDLKTIEYCERAYDTSVLSVVNFEAVQFIGADAPYPVSLAGIVPVKVECGTPIKVGDLLVSSDRPGYAQSAKAERPENTQETWDMLGSSFAKALEPCDGGEAVIKAWLI